MADVKSSLIPLNGSNFVTWKIQVRMTLIRDGLWCIVDGTEVAPAADSSEKYAKYAARRNRALATIVLAIEPKLLYLIGDPEDPSLVWKKLGNQFQKKSWANKLQLRRRLYSLKLKEGGCVQDHVKSMIEIFEELSVVGDAVDEEDRVVHLLASLPSSFDVLVTALEAHSDVPKLEIVTERLLHEEQKMKLKSDSENSVNKVLMAKNNKFKKGPKCHHCGKMGHIKKFCRLLLNKNNIEKLQYSEFKGDEQLNSESVSLVVSHALSVSDKKFLHSSWIVDSGATCHMTNDKFKFTNFSLFDSSLSVALGDGHSLEAPGKGCVLLRTRVPHGERVCTLSDVLYVPELSFNLLSISKVTKSGKVSEFSDNLCKIKEKTGNCVAVAEKVGNLYHLLTCSDDHKVNVSDCATKLNANIWHRRFGHLGIQNLKLLASKDLVSDFNLNVADEFDFCEPCVNGKNHRSKFPKNLQKEVGGKLDLIHSDVCGKIGEVSLGGGEYFLTFIDDSTRYVWVYILGKKSDVFSKFLEFKSMVENQTDRKIKTLRTDNGGEYCSNKFSQFLKDSGIRHQLTVPKNPEQNGLSERLNRSLIETVRSMLNDSKLPVKFWAEALATACYLKNLSPARALESMTPFEAFIGRKPSVKHLKIFGSVCYAHIPKDERYKLDMKSRKCIFLGYSLEIKGYRLYDILNEKIFFSRDVIFNESMTGCLKVNESSEEDAPRRVYIPDAPAEIEEMTNYNNDEDDPENLNGNENDIVVDNLNPVIVCEPFIRRSNGQKNSPNHYGEWTSVVINDRYDPVTAKEALSGSDGDNWHHAMKQEIDSIYSNKVWDLVQLPEGRKAINCRWVFKKKLTCDGAVDRYKARLVALGCSQKYGIDYDETFCPVVRFESLRMLIALAVQNGMLLQQMDVTAAFLNGKLEEEVYMVQPEEFKIKGKENLVCKLKKSIYGLKQSPRCWNFSLDSSLKRLGFIPTSGDPCLYVDNSEGELFVVAVYVDDLVLACKSERRMKLIKSKLSEDFSMKDLGDMNYILGVKVIQNKINNSIWIGQETYCENILNKFNMENSKSVSTPVDTSQKLSGATDNCEIVDQVQFQRAVGCLLYLAMKTRPDVAYAVSSVARFTSKPNKQHWVAIKRIFRYLKGTSDLGILYKNTDRSDCFGYSDADWAGDTDDRRSTSGYSFQIGTGAVSWRSKKQTCVALSTAESEYMALASATQEAVWLRQLLCEMGENIKDPTVLFEDNQSAIAMSHNPQYHGRCKHIDIKFHYVREEVTKGVVKLIYCSTGDMVADIFTKGLPFDKFEKFRRLLGLCKL